MMGSEKATATLRALKGSPQKIGLIVSGIRGMSVRRGISYLGGVRKSSSGALADLVRSAAANAKDKHGLSSDQLFVERVEVGKSMVLKRVDVRGRSRMGRIHKVWSRVSVFLGERS